MNLSVPVNLNVNVNLNLNLNVPVNLNLNLNLNVHLFKYKFTFKYKFKYKFKFEFNASPKSVIIRFHPSHYREPRTMKFLSFKIFVLCILLPPILYICSLNFAESHLKNQYAGEIEDVYIGDTRPLLDGSVRLKNAINQNIDRHLRSKQLITYGVKTEVTVLTKQGTILYPPIFEDEADPLLMTDPMGIAAENYQLMNEGLLVNVEVSIPHNTLISILMLASYMLLSLLFLYLHYGAGIRKERQADKEKSREISRLQELERNRADSLKSLEKERERLAAESGRIKISIENEKAKASKNEEGMIEEIVTLEEEIVTLEEEIKDQQEEIEALKEGIRRLEKGGRGKRATRGVEAAGKRFKALYKNISVSDRAVSGLLDLSDELRIKGEEVIHQLNENPDLVTIKRKVFGKKSKHNTILEVIFGYKGRLYFNKGKDGRIEVLAIGTKNSQVKDLEYLDNLTLN